VAAEVRAENRRLPRLVPMQAQANLPPRKAFDSAGVPTAARSVATTIAVRADAATGSRTAAGLARVGAACYRDLETSARTTPADALRSPRVPEQLFRCAFATGSTLSCCDTRTRRPRGGGADERLALWQLHGGERRYVSGAATVDSGFPALLARGFGRRAAGAPPRRAGARAAGRRHARRQRRPRARAPGAAGASARPSIRVLGTERRAFDRLFPRGTRRWQIRPLPIDRRPRSRRS